MEVAFGVIALTGQVVDTSFKIKKVVGTFKSAPEEIKGLSSKLDIVKSTCESLGKLIGEELCLFGDSSLLDEGVDTVLKSFQETLSKLEAIANKLESKGSGTKVQKLSFLSKKDDIKTLKEELDEQVNLLQLKLTTATYKKQVLWVEHPSIHDRQPEKPVSSTSFRKYEPHRQPEASVLSKTTRVALARSTTERTWIFGIRSFFENRKVTKRSKWKNGEETEVMNETSTLAFRHASSTYGIQLMWWFTGSMSISCSLSVPHHVDSRTHENIKWRLFRLCYGGSIRGLQDMFSEKVLTPTTLVDGATLFEWAASFPQPDMCRFILQQNSKLTADEYLLGSKTHPGRNSLHARANPELVSQAYVDLVGICLATEVPTVIQYRFLVSSMSQPRDMLMCFKSFQYNVFEEEWLDFIAIAWDEAVMLFVQRLEEENLWVSPPDKTEDWISLFSHLVGGGVDVSRFINGSFACRTALWEMVNVASCPRNLESALFCWGSILWACGVDFDQYLTEEWSYSDYMWKDYLEVERTFSWPRQLAQIDIGGFIFPTWTRRILPTSQAYEVREEFKFLGPYKPYSVQPSKQFRQDLAEMDNRDRHRVWKTLDHPTMEEVHLDAWPFGFCPPRDLSSTYWKWSQWYSTSKEAGQVEKSFKIAQDLLNARFERRQNKMLYKLGYLTRTKKLRNLPGAWIED